MILNLVNDLLDLAKIEAFKFKLDEDYFSLPEVVEQATSTIEPMAEINELRMKLIYQVNLNEEMSDDYGSQEFSESSLGSFSKIS